MPIRVFIWPRIMSGKRNVPIAVRGMSWTPRHKAKIKAMMNDKGV